MSRPNSVAAHFQAGLHRERLRYHPPAFELNRSTSQNRLHPRWHQASKYLYFRKSRVLYCQSVFDWFWTVHTFSGLKSDSHWACTIEHIFWKFTVRFDKLVSMLQQVEKRRLRGRLLHSAVLTKWVKDALGKPAAKIKWHRRWQSGLPE